MNQKKLQNLGVALIATTILGTTPTQAHWSASRPDGHAPIGVMGEHTHEKGEWMVSYRSMSMDMEGSLDGSDRIDDSQVVSPAGAGFIVTPTRMTMDMDMFGLMYAPSDVVTLMLMVPTLDLEMEHLTRAGGRFTTSSSGIGDIRAMALWKIGDEDGYRTHLNLGLSVPTGSIDEADVTPASAGNAVQLPYPMQVGSGTLDAIVGGTMSSQGPRWSFGLQALGTFRTGTNDRDYTLGNRTDITGWWSRHVGDATSFSLRLAWADWGDIDGADPALAGAVATRFVPTAFPDLRGGSRLDAGVGLNWLKRQGSAKGLRLAAEFLQPIQQNLDGPQLETDLTLVLGAQYAW